MSGVYTCPICGRGGWLTRPGLVTHLVDDHTPRVVAEEYVAIRVPEPKTKAGPVRCGKQPYKTEPDAMHALLDTWRAGHKSPRRKERRAYQCDRCTGVVFHLTSQPAREEASGQGIQS